MQEKPIEEFTSQEHLDECLKWWQEKLFLTDWIIKAYVIEQDEMKLENACGENDFQIVNKCSVIHIINKECYGKRVMKYCAERILVHELLHCKYNWVYNSASYEGKYTDECEHALLEQMAKSLIMTKYGLNFDYFKE